MIQAKLRSRSLSGYKEHIHCDQLLVICKFHQCIMYHGAAIRVNSITFTLLCILRHIYSQSNMNVLASTTTQQNACIETIEHASKQLQSTAVSASKLATHLVVGSMPSERYS